MSVTRAGGMMRKVVYGGAMSLDGYIAGLRGEYDWIPVDPEMDFAAMIRRFDAFLIGRRTWDVMRRTSGSAPPTPGIHNHVFSRTLRPEDCPGATLHADAVAGVTALRREPGKDIALFGGGELFRSLLAARLVDEVSVSVVPVLLGGGVPFLPPPAERAPLRLLAHRLYAATGTMRLDYAIDG